MHSIRAKAISVTLALTLALSSFCLSAAAVDKSEPTLTQGKFTCDWFDESIDYTYSYSDEWLSDSSFKYNHSLATVALGFAMASFESFDEEHHDEHIRKMLTDCGYEVESYGYDTENYDTIGVAFGKKEAEYNGEKYTIINLAIRSGNYGMEWGGNMRVGTGVNHKGFDTAKGLVIEYFNEYLSKANISGKVKLLVSGYSRGGSVANLFSASVDDGSYKSYLSESDNIAKLNLTPDNRYTYTFEAPQCTKNKNAKSSIYSNIFNIINPCDFVPKFVMDDWGFTHFGVRYELPSADNCETYDMYYDKLCKEFDTMMADTGKKSKNFFYNKEESISISSMFDYVFEGIANDIMISQDNYAENYEDGLATLAGDYLGQQLGVDDIAKTMATSVIATIISIIPSNLEIIKSDGYRAYLAKSIQKSDVGSQLTDKQTEKLLDLLVMTLEYISDNSSTTFSFAAQLKTVLYVHQPYIELTWMHILSADDIEIINSNYKTDIAMSYKSITLKYGVNARISAYYSNTSDEYVVLSSDDESIVTVDEKGNLVSTGKGTTYVTATLYSSDDKPIAKASSEVTITMSNIRALLFSLKKYVQL